MQPFHTHLAEHGDGGGDEDGEQMWELKQKMKVVLVERLVLLLWVEHQMMRDWMMLKKMGEVVAASAVELGEG